MAQSIRTQAELANELGLSRMTVQRALAGYPGVSEATRKRVFEAAQNHGYRPNAAARTMRTGKFGNIALLGAADEGAGNLPRLLLSGAQQVAQECDTCVMVSEHTCAEFERDDFEPPALKQWSADGLLINIHQEISEKLYNHVRAYKLPAVWLNVKLKSDCVRPDDHDAGYRAASMLMEAGHKHIGYISHHGERHYSIDDRGQGVTDAVNDAGLKLTFNKHYDGFSICLGMENVMQWIQSPKRPTGVVCYEQQEAVSVYTAAMKLGLRVPEDLSIICFAASPCRIATGLPISTLVVPFEQVGRAAMTMLLDWIDTGKGDNAPVALPFDYDEAGSIVPPACD
ncbi:MAG: LacI family DNA-binding transcriptional regulator [Phycisphaeraceae bacterium JB051]